MSDDNSGGGGIGDRFTEVSQQSWLSQLAGSFVAVIFGIILFFASFVVLSWNEGRAVRAIGSLNSGARMVVSVPDGTVNPANQGRLVHLAGDVTVNRAAADPVFHVTAAGTIRLKRTVKMYQWEESEHSETQKNTGGSQTTTTTYTYKKVWSERPVDSSDFKHPSGHINPQMPLHSGVFNGDAVKLGAFRLDASLVNKMSNFEALSPPDTATGSGVNPSFQRVGETFYHGASSETPAIGDMQVSYEVIKPQPFSIVAAQIGDTLAPFRGSDGQVIELIDAGTRDAGAMFQEAKSEAAMWTWILRGVGYVMMIIGIAMLASPLTWLASVLPFLAGIVEAGAFLVALVVATPLTLLTIAIAWLAHRPLVGGGLIILGVVLGFGLHRLVRSRRTPPAMRHA
jgi:Transmembrane protein 43